MCVFGVSTRFLHLVAVNRAYCVVYQSRMSYGTRVLNNGFDLVTHEATSRKEPRHMIGDGNFISQVPLFGGLDDSQQISLQQKMGHTTLRRGETLFDEGDLGDRLYIITEGKVKLGHTSNDGRESLLAVLGPGEIIGELTLFDPGPRSTTATAVSPVSLLHLDHEDLMEILDTNPTLAKHMLKALAQRLRRTNESLSDLVFSDVPGRVAKALLDLADRFGTASDKGVHVPHDLTQEELAQLVGASRETVNKSLADFVSRGWIRLEGRAVTLLDVDRLARRAR
ncbi:hypothetical protein HMPREF9241_00244 [Schaalia turicensis ACS-279-V-Col4]|uniref:CRP-like cAMP-activated global transcriptional regulator n=2 Tax=Schaalia turicensis TaxID=131111 RepID=K0YVJ6_9ACTO|nr:hypothetical protein HMPREF9241_00244 [Schaalia turicensis ACS-279-V-Col4]